MPVIVNFCSYFSVRLGSIIVGAFSLMQGAAMMLVSWLGLHNSAQVSETMTEFMNERDFLFMTAFLNSFKKNPEDYLYAFIITSAVYSLTCILVMYGAYVLNMFLLAPFVVSELLRIGLVGLLVVSTMLILKKNSLDLGVLMGGSIIGGFVLLFLLYLWACPTSLLQELFRLRREAPPIEEDPMEAKLWQQQRHEILMSRQRPMEVNIHPQYSSYVAYPAYPGYRHNAMIYVG